MNARALLLALALSSCGPGRLVAAVQGGDPAEALAAVELAERLLDDSGQWPAPSSSALLVVHPTLSWERGGGRWVGYASWPDTIEVGSDFAALLHEALHVQDWQAGRLYLSDASGHAGWELDGRWALSDLFSFIQGGPEALALDGDQCLHAAGMPPAMEAALRSSGWRRELQAWANLRAQRCAAR